MFPILLGLLAVSMAIEGIQDSQARIFHFALAAGHAALAVLWAPLISRALTRQPARLEHLRTQINDPTARNHRLSSCHRRWDCLAKFPRLS